MTQKRQRVAGRLLSRSELRLILHQGGYSKVGDKELDDLEAAMRETLASRIRAARGYRATKKRGWKLTSGEAVFIGGLPTPKAKEVTR